MIGKNLSYLHNLVLDWAYFLIGYEYWAGTTHKIGLVIEYGKTEVSYSRLQSFFDSFLLNLSHIRGPILQPKNLWKYLGFIFDKNLLFVSISNCIPIKLYLQSNVWKCSETWCMDFFLIRNTFFTEYVFFLLLFMASFYGITINCHYLTCLTYLIEYNKEQHYEFLVLFILYPLYKNRGHYWSNSHSFTSL